MSVFASVIPAGVSVAGLTLALWTGPMVQVQGDFSGTWLLNVEQSDLPGLGGGMREGREARRRSREGGNAPTAGAGDGEVRLVISQTVNTVEVEQQGGMGLRQFSLKPGAGPTRVRSQAGEVKMEARWEEDRLKVHQVLQRETPRGSMEIQQEQIWELSADGQVLTQRITMRTPRGERTAIRVFERQ